MTYFDGSLEDLVTTIFELSPTDSDARNAVTLWQNRLHISRSRDGDLELFVEGDRPSFGNSILGRALEFGRFRDAIQNREFDAVLISAGGEERWIRPVAHIAYEAVQLVREDPNITNERLFELIAIYLGLISEKELMSVEQQGGLIGELLFLQELLTTATSRGLPTSRVLNAWKGWDSASRDFAHDEVAVEVKTSATGSRQHWIQPIEQLLGTSSGERVYLLSIGIVRDRSRSLTLISMINRVTELLDPAGTNVLEHYLEGYCGIGYTSAQIGYYSLEPGFRITAPASLFRVDNLSDIMRPEVFVLGQQPARVVEIGYRLSLDGLSPLTAEERNTVVNHLIS
jgi:hypothetical protein